MKLQDFMNKVFSEFTNHITDQIFLYIQNKPDLYKEYMRVIGRDSNLDATNPSKLLLIIYI